MRRVLKWLGIGFGALLLLAVGIWVSSRMMGPTEAQERALAVMMRPVEPPPGRNAFPALWLLPYDVPEDQLEAVTAEDAKRMAAWPLPDYENSDDAAAHAEERTFASVAEKRYGRIIAEDRKGPDYCNTSTQDCSAEVRENLSAYRAWRQSESKLLENLQTLASYDYLHNQMPPRIDTPFVELRYFGALPTLRALDFSEGRIDAALAGDCGDIAAMRRFAISSDWLIYTMVSVAYDRVGMKLLGEMLRDLPPDHELLPGCRALMQLPKPEEMSLCNSLRGEFAFGEGIMAQMQDAARKNPVERLKLWLFHNPAKSRALLAANYARNCSDEHKVLLRSDQPARMPIPSARLGVKDYFQCADNAIGCMLMRIAAPAYSDYSLRMQDMGARDQLLATLLWLREHADDRRPLAERLASRPANLKSPSRDVRIVDGGKALAIPMYDQSREKEFELPLPAYLQDAAVTN